MADKPEACREEHNFKHVCTCRIPITTQSISRTKVNRKNLRVSSKAVRTAKLSIHVTITRTVIRSVYSMINLHVSE